MRVKKWKKKKYMIIMLVIRVLLCSDPIDVSEECKKRISISHILKKKLKFQRFLIV